MTSEQIRSLQRKLKDAGLYSGPIDGKMGSGTRAAQQQFNATVGARTAEAAAKKATADAEAKRAEVEAARVKADADRQAAADKRADERASAKRDSQGFRSIATAAGLGIGFVGGKVGAHFLDKRFQASVAVKNKALGNLAAVSAKTGPAAATKAATRAGLTHARAPLGIGIAAALIAEAAYTRFVVSPSLEDSPKSQAVADATATASTMGAIALVGQQAINRRTPKAVIDAAALATISTGSKPVAAAPTAKAGTVKALRAEAKSLGLPNASKMKKADLQKALAKATPQAAAGSKSLAGGFKRLLGRSMPAVAALLFAGAGYTQAVKAGESQGDAAKAGAKAGADALTAGAVSAYERAKETGLSSGLAAVRGGVEGLANFMSFGLAGMLAAKAAGPDKGYVPETVARRAKERAAKANAEQGAKPDRLVMAGAGALMTGMGLHTIHNSRGASGMMKVAGRAGGAGMAVAGMATLAAAVLGPGRARGDGGKAYINDAARTTAQKLPKPAAPGGMSRPTAQTVRPDGMTAGYMRIDPRTGKTVQVKGYRTPGR